jgi:hypothetical protein
MAPEVYLADVQGGNERRLTYWGDSHTRVCGWDLAGAIIAITATAQPFSHFTWAYAVPAGAAGENGAAGGDGPRRLPFGPVGDLAVGRRDGPADRRDGQRVPTGTLPGRDVRPSCGWPRGAAAARRGPVLQGAR